MLPLKQSTLAMAAGLVTSLAASAQINYVDAIASTGGNTTLADGSTYTPAGSVPTLNNDWAERAFANGGNIFSSNEVGAEDAPMLRTTLSGLNTGTPYDIYVYFWGVAAANWRGHALASTAQPAPGLPGYNTRHSSTSLFSAMVALGTNAPVGTGPQFALQLRYDAAGYAIGGHFANPVLIQEGNRWLYERHLGSYVPDVNGQIHIYIDDFENQTSSNNRTWYDGVGFAPAPAAFGNGCGNPVVPTIGSSGNPVWGQQFSLTLSNAPATSVCSAVLGLSDTTWSGIPLPFQLLPGCPLNVSFDYPTSLATNASGAASLDIPLPILNGSATVFWQWVVVTPSGASLVHMSQGLRTTFRR